MKSHRTSYEILGEYTIQNTQNPFYWDITVPIKAIDRVAVMTQVMTFEPAAAV